MRGKRIVTSEIAHQIYYSFEALRSNGVKFDERIKTIQSDILDEFGVDIRFDTVKQYAQQTFDEIQEYVKKWREGRKKLKEK